MKCPRLIERIAALASTECGLKLQCWALDLASLGSSSVLTHACDARPEFHVRASRGCRGTYSRQCVDDREIRAGSRAGISCAPLTP